LALSCHIWNEANNTHTCTWYSRYVNHETGNFLRRCSACVCARACIFRHHKGHGLQLALCISVWSRLNLSCLQLSVCQFGWQCIMQSDWLIHRCFFDGTVAGSCVKAASCFGSRLVGYVMTIHQLPRLLISP
jgi:hypothetical protein